MHARSGGQYEVMGLMQGKLGRQTILCTIVGTAGLIY